MAAGSSAPELFTSLVATFLIVNEGGVGAIIGSAIFNILVIVGATCCFAGRELVIWWYPLARDICFYILAIVELAVALEDSEVLWWEGLMMALTYGLYIFYMYQNHKVVKRLGGPPGDSVEDVEDPEIKKPASQESDKCEKLEEVEGPRSAALVESEAVPQIEIKPTETLQKAQDNPNSPDFADEESCKENSLKPQDSETKTDASKKEAEEHPKTEMAGMSTSEKESHVGGKLTVPGAEMVTHSPRSDRDGGEGSHHPHWSLHEVHSHQGDEECKGAPSSMPEGVEPDKPEESESKGFSCPDPLNKLWELIMPSPERYWLLFSASIAFIAICTYIMVDAVNRIGCNLNIEPLIMGLIFLAAGTSVPDALGSIAVAKQGEGDMAVANAFGSNVFDILLGLGVPWFLSTAVLGQTVAFPGAGSQLLEWILILTVILVAFVGALAFNKMRLNQMMGGMLMTLYLVYVVVALVRALAFK